MKDVFISYKTEEFNEAYWLKATLETNGISCWMAPMNIPGGSSYAVEIPQAIRECKVFVLVLSRKCQESKWVPRELDQAINEGKTVLPFMLENCPLRDDFNFYLTNVQRYAAYESKSKAAERMIYEIKAIIESQNKEREKSFELFSEKQKPVDDTVYQNPNDMKRDDSAQSEEKKAEKKPKPVRKAKKKRSRPPRKSPSIKEKRTYTPLIIAAAVVVALVAAIVAMVFLNRVTICGENFRKGAYSITLEEKKITQEDIDKLSEFRRLNSVTFTDCEITAKDLSAIGKDITGLYIDNCGLTDELLNTINFEALNIYQLDLDNNKGITDLSCLEPLSDTIGCLSFNNCSVTNLRFATKFSELTEISGDSNGIADVTPLSNLTGLYKISLNNNNIKEIKSLDKLINLTHVYFAGNEITSISGLQNTTLLTEFDFSGNKIYNIDILEKSCDKLSIVRIADCGIARLDSLKNCVNLKVLVADNNSISDISVLKNLEKLEKVTLRGNIIDNISALKNLKSLNHIDLGENHLKEAVLDLSKSEYVYLDLSDNNISYLSLPSKNYTFLDIHGNKLENLSMIKKCTGGRLVFDYNDNINFEELSSTGFYSYYLIDCPLDKQVGITAVFGENNVEYITADYIPKIIDELE